MKIESSFTKVPNHVLEGLALSKLNGTQYKIIFAICRYTYGFHREAHKLSISFISNAIDGEARNVRREINNLINENILHVSKKATFRNPRILAINENIDAWCIKEPLRSNSPREEELAPSGRENSPYMREGEIAPQEIKKEISKERAIEEYFEKIWSIYPNQIGKSNITEEQKEKLYNEVPLNQMVKAINNYKQESQGRKSRFIKHGGNFFNGDYIEYLPPKGQTIPQPKEIKILDYDDKIKQLQEEEERRYQAR